MIRIESNGSFWFFEEPTKTYRRLPKQEGPREHFDWYNDHPSLEDLVPHKFLDWIRTDQCLVILLDDGMSFIYAPIGEGATNEQYWRLQKVLLERNPF